MNSNTIAKGIVKAVAVILAIALALYALYLIRSVIAYILIAAVVALIGRPIVLFLEHKLKFKKSMAAVVAMLILLCFVLGLISLFIPLVIKQSENLALLDINKLEQNVLILYNEALNYFNLKNIDLSETFKESGLLSKVNIAVIPELLNGFISGLGSFSIGLFSVLFISFFFLKDSKLFESGVLTFVPNSKTSGTRTSILKIKGLLSRYFNGLLLQITILFVIYTIVLLVFGINNAVVIAFLCALLNLIPYVGPIISAILLILLSMSSNLGESFQEVILPTTAKVFIGFIVAQLVDNFFSQPFIFSKSVKSHPLEIFLIIIIGGLLFGILGMILAVPSYTALKVVLKEFLSDYTVIQKLTRNVD
jgi:predicted PurR-regulated permease PerM